MESSHKLYEVFYDKGITPTSKKYSVFVLRNNKPHLIHFGYRSMQHYHDKIGRWKHLDHNDKERRKNYLARAKGIRDKYGNLTYKDKNHANFYAIRYLW